MVQIKVSILGIIDTGGCQNSGPFLGTLNIRCRIIIGTQKGTIILTTTQYALGQSFVCRYLGSFGPQSHENLPSGRRHHLPLMLGFQRSSPSLRRLLGAWGHRFGIWGLGGLGLRLQALGVG